MTAVNWRAVLTAAIASSVLFAVTAGAQAHDGERWERERWEHRDHFVPPGHRHHYERAPRVVYERQPVVVMPVPVYQAPDYSQPMNSSLNFNFTIPLQ
jgi:hypothetical protein